MAYKKSIYTLVYECADDLILHSTLTRETVRVKKADFEDAINGRETILHKTLAEKLIIVKEGIDETKVATKFYDNLKSDTLRLVVLTTEACNFQCVYCYQNGMFDNPKMLKSDTVNELGRWIETYLSQYPNLKQIGVCFFGGEPLLNYCGIKETCEIIRGISERYNIGMFTQLVTNGSIWDEEKMKSLLAYNLTCVEITVDGPKEVHDIRRPFKNGSSSYQQVIDTIVKMAQYTKNGPISLLLRVNVDESNVDSITIWLKELSQKLPKNRVEVVLAPVIDSVSYTVKDQTAPKKNLVQEISEIYYDSKEHGFIVDIEIGHRCTFENEHQYVLVPEGNLFKCNAAAGIETFKVGSIYSNLNETCNNVKDLIQDKMKLMTSEKCIHCTYMPYCRGGCRFQAYVSKTKLDSSTFAECRRNQYDDLIKLKIKADGIVERHELLN